MTKIKTLKKILSGLSTEKGAITVEYVVVISLLIGVTLVAIILLVDPTGTVNDSILPQGYNAVSQKIGTFGTLPE